MVKDGMEIDEDNLFLVAFIFEQANGIRLDEMSMLMIDESELCGCSAESLEAALVEALNAGQPASYRNTAYWALSKRFNRELIPLFKRWMSEELHNQDPGAVYQLLIALDNVREPVFGKDRNGSYSVKDTRLNIRDAQEYLERNA